MNNHVLNWCVSVLLEMDTPTGSTKKRRKSAVQMQRDTPEGNSILVKHKVKLQQTNGMAVRQQKRKTTKPDPSPSQKMKVKARIPPHDENHRPKEKTLSSAGSSRISMASSDSFAGEVTMSVTSGKSPKKRKKSKASLTEPDESWEKAVERARGMPDGAFGGVDSGEDEATDEGKKAGDKAKKMPLNVCCNFIFICSVGLSSSLQLLACVFKC